VIKPITTAALAAALILGAASLATAMEEQKIAPVPQAQPAATPDVSPLGVQDATQVRKQETGTEIRIPGLGKLGTLPKMDFGLELLYGATENKGNIPDSGLDENQDLTIRGSVKHKF
jgi:hypothetical protein